MKEALKSLSSLTAQLELGSEKKGYRLIPLFNPKNVDAQGGYEFRQKTLLEILDTLCEAYGLDWQTGDQPDLIILRLKGSN